MLFTQSRASRYQEKMHLKSRSFIQVGMCSNSKLWDKICSSINHLEWKKLLSIRNKSNSISLVRKRLATKELAVVDHRCRSKSCKEQVLTYLILKLAASSTHLFLNHKTLATHKTFRSQEDRTLGII